MVLFTQLKVENFKRFKGEHILPLHGEGPITVIAAENAWEKPPFWMRFTWHFTRKRG